jgi:hypothetical protein
VSSGAVTLAILLLLASESSADEPSVPISLQAELTCKLVKFDRNFAVRAGDKAMVLIVFKKGGVDSERIAKQLKAAFETQSTLGGVAHEETLLTYSGPAALLAEAKKKKAALIILSPGVSADAQAIAKAFDGYDGVTISTSVEGVEQGIVLGFDLVSGKPKMLLNLEQARRQNADFRSEVLRLMKVYP